MRLNTLRITRCHLNCPKCGIPSDEFKMFESGLGGDFETYVGAPSGRIYRLDLGKIHYQHMTHEDLLAPAIKIEGTLLKVPDDFDCKFCGSKLHTKSGIPIDGEEFVEAYEL